MITCYPVWTAAAPIVRRVTHHIGRRIAHHGIRHAALATVRIVCIATPAWIAAPSPAAAPDAPLVDVMPPPMLPWPGDEAPWGRVRMTWVVMCPLLRSTVQWTSYSRGLHHWPGWMCVLHNHPTITSQILPPNPPHRSATPGIPISRCRSRVGWRCWVLRWSCWGGCGGE